MYRILALAALAVALPSSVLAQTAPSTTPSAAPEATTAPATTTAPSAVAEGDDKEHKHKHAYGCGDNVVMQFMRGQTTNPSCVVPRNHVLFEGGYNNLSRKGLGNVVTYPTTILRVGTAVKGLEFDVVPPSEVRQRTGNLRTRGTTDVGAGLDYQLPFGNAPIRATISTFVTAPTGSRGFGTTRGSDAQVGLNLGTTFGKFDINGSASFRTTVDPITGLRYRSFVPSIALSDRLGFGKNPGAVFVEAARFSRVASYGRAEMLYTGGYKQPIGKRTVVDAEYSTTPNLLGFKAHSIGGGVSILF